MELLLFGATGAVGRQVLQQALDTPGIRRITAPTRRPLAPHDKLDNPVQDFRSPLPDADWWRADALICCLGTTLKQAGGKAGFHAIDHDLVLAVAQRAHDAGTPVMVLNSSMGANARSLSFYLRTKGEVEQALQTMGFDRLVLVRPSLIDARREEKRLGEDLGLMLSRRLGSVIPARYRPVRARDIAACMIDSVSRPGALEMIGSDAIARAGNSPG
ncbi:Rossmann-fold NAD(P)-binding domain-containing protein [Marinobacter bohaiensis]|uniref:NAD-dependent dehydratase n=1 Tax=Marinobacter bohaiensis TaxID=2201898 RepID=UPI000DAB5EB9|nr:NAD-dependent dehydratase [Marinobacter bohaiensis]